MTEAVKALQKRMAMLADHPGLVLAFAVALQVLFWTQTPWDWWFEDDTPHLVYVRDNLNPVAYFYDRELILKLSFGFSLTPWFPFTFWLDRAVAPLSPVVAYLHTIFALWGVAALLQRVLDPYLGRKWSLLAGIFWLFLPSTVVITEFLSTRHYLEGLGLSLLAVLCADRASRGQGRYWGWTFGAAGAYLLATTTKEVYVSSTWVILLLFFGLRKRFGGLAVVFLCGPLYAAYRLWAIGGVGKQLSLDILSQYHLFLGRLPYIFAGNELGYLLLPAALASLVWLWRQGRLTWCHLILFALNLGVMFLTILPVTANITHQYLELGTWYRVAFVFNTFLLAGLAWLASRLAPKYGLALALLLALSLGIGAKRTAHRWDDLKRDYREDAAFYLQYPDRLLFSELPAPWFLYGVHHAYQPELPKHYLSYRVDQGTPRDYVLAQTEKYQTVWRKVNGEYRPDSDLLKVIRANCLQGRLPLNLPFEE